MNTDLVLSNGQDTSETVPAKQLALPGFKSTATGLVPNKTLTADQWEDAGQVLGHIEQRLSWFLGDWITVRREKWE